MKNIKALIAAIRTSMFIPANSQIFGQLFLQIELVPTNESGDFDSSIRAPVCGTKNVTRRNVAVMDPKKSEQKNSIVFLRVLSGDVSEVPGQAHWPM